MQVMRFSPLLKSKAPQHQRRTNKPPALKLSFRGQTNQCSVVHRHTSTHAVFESPPVMCFSSPPPLCESGQPLCMQIQYLEEPSAHICTHRKNPDETRRCCGEVNNTPAGQQMQRKENLLAPFMSVCVYSVTGPTCSFLSLLVIPFSLSSFLSVCLEKEPQKKQLSAKSCAKTQADFRSVVSLFGFGRDLQSCCSVDNCDALWDYLQVIAGYPFWSQCQNPYVSIK